LCEYAQAARRTRCQFKSKYAALAAWRGSKKAIIAIAHKLLRMVSAPLQTGACYRNPDVDYEALTVQKYGHLTA
jgi:transposase